MRGTAFTGGGVFGYVQAIAMAACEPETLGRIDFHSGTSIGGFLALGLSAGIPPSKLAHALCTMAPRVFAGRWWRRRVRALLHPRYDAAALDAALEEVFGTMRCADLLKPAIVCTHDLAAGRPRAIWTPEHPQALVRDLARQTMAAHTYFRRCAMQRDGGVFNNDPSLAAIFTLLRVHAARLDSLALFALGNGRNPTHRTEQNYPEPHLVTGILAELVNDQLDGASVVWIREQAELLLRTYGGRYEAFEFPDTDMDMDDPAVIDMIRDRWTQQARQAAERMDAFFLAGVTSTKPATPEFIGNGLLNSSIKLWAAFGEYQDIWPTTVRYSEAEAIEALRAEPVMRDVPDSDLFSRGPCIGWFEQRAGIFIGGGPADPKPADVHYTRGFRAPKGADFTPEHSGPDNLRAMPPATGEVKP